MSERCLVPDCTSTLIHLRGICRACYIYAASLVFHKLTTWEQLEALGCVGPSEGQVQSPKRPRRTEWFAKAAGLTPEGLVHELRRRVADYSTRNGPKPRRIGKQSE